jgi:Lon protease-like protein
MDTTGEGRREIFLFPLGTVLFPSGALPLKIFEQRYLDMTKVCLRDSLPFGVCLIREGSEVGAPAIPQQTGCLATIEQWEMPNPGIFHLLARGGARFHVRSTRCASNGLLSGEIELLPEPAPATADPTCAELLRAMIEKIGVEHFPQPLCYDDAAWVVYRLAELLPVEATLRQHLLEFDNAAALTTEFKNSVLKQILT